MSIEGLLVDPERREHRAVPEADALREPHGLQEAQLLDVRVDALGSTAWLLFDCRGALQIEMGNTAVIAVHGLLHLSWVATPRQGLTAWSVVGSEPSWGDEGWALALSFSPRARLEINARSAEFFVGNVPGCDDAPPNYVEDDEVTVRAGLARWSSPFEPIHASFVDSMPRPPD